LTSKFDETQKHDSGCGLCHIAAGPDAMPVTVAGEPIEATEASKDQIDCVLCHGKTYDGGGEAGQRVVRTDNQNRNYWSYASLADAQSVGDKVTSQACNRCHVNTGGKVFSPDGTMSKAFKYGTDYVADSYELVSVARSATIRKIISFSMVRTMSPGAATLFPIRLTAAMPVATALLRTPHRPMPTRHILICMQVS
jgi:hypothetical protein